ncbi:DNA mismatch repair endonuclease MutL [Anaerofustis stercorihominis]|uniref:DNA mismatch repair protein MutL n=3 Tax=Anaerofustis stercorihominis TaxID=214853 RepID=B1C6T5_9FIRM|nr:DNA mismatch repair endonuclease MutL [Anaerofustis stercorihominis]EDS72722.1 DNA mismatch repair domain protein [Anaerofustis stercorihominis DSM 17244]RGD74603.1 DNA mismatch repair endonuclease MutL [Anaerofustis stercorihominis]
MANVIKKLSDELINKISAGEVVVSPASVIKELVENSIDAGADHIKIKIENGGKTKILVSDNGIGIKSDEMGLAFNKNATSKIDSLDKLSSIDTLGFRGEALFSISVVSKVKIRSKYKDENIGTSATVINGKVQNIKNLALNTGTRIEVEDLFYNTPARRKHMKSAKAEKTASLDIISKLAIANPSIAFSVYSDNKEVFVTLGDNNIRNVVSVILGHEFVSKMIEVDYDDEPLTVKGFTLSPNYLDRQNEESIFIINGRYVKNDTLNKVINNIYREQYGLFTKRISYVLYIRLPYNFTDVNIHPAKTSISFRNETLINMLICEGVRSALRESINLNDNVIGERKKKENPLENQIAFEESSSYVVGDKDISIVSYNEEIKIEKKEIGEDNINEEASKSDIINTDYIASYDKYSEPTYFNESSSTSYTSFDDNLIQDIPIINPTENNLSLNRNEEVPKEQKNIVDRSIFDKIINMHFVGTAFKAYAIFESGETLYVMDTHASHERVLYDKYLSEFKKHRVKTQILVSPLVLELSVIHKDICLNHLKLLKSLGYEIEDFAGNNVIIREIPEMLSLEDTKEVILNLLASLKDTSMLTNEINRNERLIKNACHHAVRGHDDISKEEAIKLLNDLKLSDNPFSCPHSRPTISKIKKKYFEKMFQRI